ncbi:MAG: hypothetical protein AAGB19_03680 [Cyanobacteria bacterium P01_F01_bin.3]
MAQQLKRWESPRRKGRNHKGRGGSAKQRQYKKRQKLLMKRLKSGLDTAAKQGKDAKVNKKEEAQMASSFFMQSYPDEGGYSLFIGTVTEGLGPTEVMF